MNIFKTIKSWWTMFFLEKEMNKEIDQNVNMYYHRPSTEAVQDDETVQQKYFNGITLMKRRLKEKMAGVDPHTYLSSNPVDLLALAKDEDAQRKALREVREAAYVFSGMDVKTEADKTKMVDERIGHYYKLQRDKEERSLLRQIRAAYGTAPDVHRTLLEEWEKKYGKPRNNSSRY